MGTNLDKIPRTFASSPGERGGLSDVSIDSQRVVTIDYTNYRGQRNLRKIKPIRIFFSANEWHKEPQWLLEAFDIEKNADRTFALQDIHAWTPGQ